MPTILLAGTLDTKGGEYAYVRDRLRARGVDVLVMDLGILGEPAFAPDISAADVARAGGADLTELRSRGDRGPATDAMQQRGLRAGPSSSTPRAASTASWAWAAGAAPR